MGVDTISWREYSNKCVNSFFSNGFFLLLNENKRFQCTLFFALFRQNTSFVSPRVICIDICLAVFAYVLCIHIHKKKTKRNMNLRDACTIQNKMIKIPMDLHLSQIKSFGPRTTFFYELVN